MRVIYWTLRGYGKFVDSVTLAEAIGKLRTVPLDEGFVHATRSLGISFGD